MVVQGRLTSEAYYCWPFPHTGLPYHRRLPGPSESQGTPRLTVAWRQKTHVWKRSPCRPRCPGFWDMQKPVGSQPEGPMLDRPALGLTLASCQGPAVPHSFLTTEPGLLPTLQPWTFCPGHEQGRGSRGGFPGLGQTAGPSLPLLCPSLPALLLHLLGSGRGGARQTGQKPLFLVVGASWASPWGR